MYDKLTSADILAMIPFQYRDMLEKNNTHMVPNKYVTRWYEYKVALEKEEKKK